MKTNQDKATARPCIKVSKRGGFTTCFNAREFAHEIAGEYATKAEREALVKLFPKFLALDSLTPIADWNNQPSVPLVEKIAAELAALEAVAEAVEFAREQGLTIPNSIQAAFLKFAAVRNGGP